MFKCNLNLHDQNITDKTFNLMVNLYCSWCKCTFGKLFSVVSCGSLLSPSKQPFGFWHSYNNCCPIMQTIVNIENTASIYPAV